MNKLKKIIYLIVAINILYTLYLLYNNGYKYNANNPKSSLNMMTALTNPLDRTKFLKAFSIACDNTYNCLNLHGLTKGEIFEIAKKKIIIKKQNNH